MKKNKNMLIILGLAIVIACAGLLSACGGESAVASISGTHGEETKPWLEKVQTQDAFREWCDTETGVHYMLYSDWSADGYAGGITLRYNADGTPYNCKTEEGE